MLLSESTGDGIFRYYYDSTGKVASIVYKKGDGEERGYYYDNETGFYYLNARYYDPQIRRFISADSMNVLMIATTSINCKNLFAYGENNPVTNKDTSGGFAESAFDIVTLAGSVVDVCCNPTDPWAWAGLVGDAVDLIPCVTGVGEAARGLKTVANTAEMADNVTDAAKVVNKAGKTSVKPYEVTTYEDFKARSIVGDNLEGHELWQHANLKQNGYATTRLSTDASKQNVVIALPREVHGDVSKAQKSLNTKSQSPLKNITTNADILYKHKSVPNSQVDKALKATIDHYSNITK